MTKNRTVEHATTRASSLSVSPFALDQPAKGTHRSMWEFLTQLRLSLPYLARQAPRLDRSLAKPSPEFGDLSQAISQIQTGVRDLEVQARNQALQMERIEQQIAGWRVVQQANLEQNLELIAEVGSLRRWVIAVGIAILVLLLAGGGMMLFLGVAGGKD